MTGPDHDAPQDLAAAYALGALPADEARRFEAVLAASPEAQREVAEYREVAALLARTRSSARLRAMVVSQPATEPRAASNRGASRQAWANASSTTSSASARCPEMRYATAYSTAP